MRYRSIGQSDIEVSAVCMGCWSIVGDPTWGHQNRSEAVAAINASLEAGINFFDTAVAYGDGASEALLGETLSGRRDQVAIATKLNVDQLRRQPMFDACHASLKRLRTDVIDLYQIHWPSRKVPLEESIDALEQLQQQGKIRAYGVSNFGPQDLTEAMARGRVQSNQMPYSLLMRSIEYEVVPSCGQHQVDILCYSPLAQGLLTGKFASADEVPQGRARTRLFSSDRPGARHQEPGCEAEVFAALEEIRQMCQSIGQPMNRVALAWLLAQQRVGSVIVGARSARQATDNAAAAELSLPAELTGQLARITEPVKAKLGPNPDPWQSTSRMR